MGKCIQKIFFGPPGCGKSYRVRQEAEKELGIDKASSNMIETAFHPEYGYGDLVAKLLPQTGSRKVAYTLENLPSEHLNGATLTQTTNTPTIEYRIHVGPLIKALARAYADSEQNVLLVIDEINRGNCAQIFGDIFQLLDRDDKGWSEYGIDPSDLIMEALKKELTKIEESPDRNQVLKKIEETLKHLPVKRTDAENFKLRLPPNLSLIGTMNTSDESVYYMDTAFKRRWDFKYMAWDGMIETSDSPHNAMIESQKNAKIKIQDTEHTWHKFLKLLNAFIADEFKGRNVDDKQVGIWFLKAFNLPQLTTRAKILVSEDQVSLVRDLLQSNHKDNNGWDYWTGYFKVEKVGDINNILMEKYKIDCTGFNWDSKKYEYFVKNLIEQILIKKPTRIKIKETLCASESKEEATKKICNPDIALADIKNKLMFFLWDNVFPRDHTPLYKLLKDGGENIEPRTFGEFAEKAEVFIKGVIAQMPEDKNALD
jgi:5-methylcytosine-specific restriction enzyme B